MKHKHAELMAQYAQDAMETNKPWERWEIKHSRTEEWRQCNNNPPWQVDMEYRRKPQKIKMWQWIATFKDGEVFLTQFFSSDDPYINEDVIETIGKAEWTEIEV